VKCNKFVLHVRPGTHLLSRAKKHPDFSLAGLLKQFFFLHIRIGFVYELHFTFRNTSLNQLLSDVVIDGKCAVILRRGKVTEHKLCRFLVGIFFPYPIDVIDAGIDFTALKIRQHIV